MPIEYTVRDGLLDARASGVLDDETLLAYVRAVMIDPAYDAAVADLFDARDVTEVRLSAEGIRAISAIIQQSRLSSPKIAIVASLPAMFGMARMFEQLRDDVKVAVFRDVDEALAWIDRGGEPAGR